MSDAGDGTIPPGPDRPGNGEGGPEAVGSVADEAAKLLGALSDWTREHRNGAGHGVSDLAGGAASAFHEINEHIATGSQDCVYCPVCRTIHVARTLSPDVRNHLATAAASLMQAAAGVLATVAADESRRAAAQGEDIEKIRLDDDWPDED